MEKYHQPLNFPANRSKRIQKAIAADEGCIAVGGLAARSGQLRDSAVCEASTASGADASLQPVSGIAAIARLVQLARREARQDVEHFARKVGLSAEELQAIETGCVIPEPRILYTLSESLDVSYQKLLTLAGHRRQRDEALEQQVLRFAASSAPMDKLSKSEAQALHDFLHLLHD